MAILAGIDEAGFGPLLGPLVVSSVAFRLPDERSDGCLWEMLRASCTKSPGSADHRLPITDSKKLHNPKHGIAALERTALVFLALSSKCPGSLRALLKTVAPAALDHMAEYPWYFQADPSLPASEGAGDVMTQANAVRRDLLENDISLLRVRSEPVPEGHYNRLVGRTRNKSIALLGLVTRLVNQILSESEEKLFRIRVDRLGGRIHYREPLMTAFPDFELTIHEESPEQSAYRLCDGSRTCDITFVTQGETKHFPIALASIYSKYLRELFMHAFNAYWCAQLEGLRPTAGYYTDAKRWLTDAAPAIKRLAVDRNMLVRSR